MAALLGEAKDLVAARSKYFKESGLDLDKDSQEQIIEALYAEPRMLRRPILSDGKRVISGFDKTRYAEFFA